MIGNKPSHINRIKKTIKLVLYDLTNWRYKRLSQNYDISSYRRIYLIHIRKTGGTSINKMFLSLGNHDPQKLYRNLAKKWRLISDGKVFVAYNAKLINKGDYFYAFSHCPLHQLQLPENTFTVTCFRDPVQRVISYYQMLLQMQKEDVDSPDKRFQVGLLEENFDDFVDRIPKEYLLNQLYMFSENFDINQALDRIQHISHYFFTEEFDRGIKDLNDKLNLTLNPIHYRKATIKVEIPNRSIVRLREKLAMEYALIQALKK